MKFLVTGGAGFIGSHIAEEILRQKLGEVVVFDDLSSGHEANLGEIRPEISFIKGDIRDVEALKGVMPGIDIVFHEAAFVSAFDSYNKPELNNAINIDGTRNVLEAGLMAGTKRVVLASSAAIYGTKSALPNKEDMSPHVLSPYAISKLENEKMALEFSDKGLETVCLRYFNVYGPRQNPSSEYSGVISKFIDLLQCAETPIIYGDGKQSRDFINVCDVAKANILAAMSPNCGAGEIFNIGTGKEVNLLRLIDVLKKIYNKNITPHFKPQRIGDIARSVADVAKAKKVLGFGANVDFANGIKELVRYYGTAKACD